MRTRLAALFIAAAGLHAQGVAWSPARYIGGDFPLTSPLVASGGEVFLDVGVAADGHVDSISVLRTTPPFTDALVAAVNGWRFAPASIDSSADASHVLVAGTFAAPALRGPTLGQLPQDLLPSVLYLPTPVATVPLVYPPRATGGGTVLVELTIDGAGPPASARVVVSTPGFDEAALASARAWRFRPAEPGRRALSARAYLVCVFPQPVTAR